MQFRGWEEAGNAPFEDYNVEVNIGKAQQYTGGDLHTSGYKSNLVSGLSDQLIVAADAKFVNISKVGYLLKDDSTLFDVIKYVFSTDYKPYQDLMAFTRDGFTLVSSDPSVVEVQADNTLKALGVGGESATLTATFTHPISGVVATSDFVVTIDPSAVSVAFSGSIVNAVEHNNQAGAADSYNTVSITDDAGNVITEYPSGAGIGYQLWDVTFDSDRVTTVARWSGYTFENCDDAGRLSFNNSNAGSLIPFEDFIVTATLTQRTANITTSIEATLVSNTDTIEVRADAANLTIENSNGNAVTSIYTEDQTSNIDDIFYNFDVNTPTYIVTPAFVRDGFTLTSSDSAIIEINADNTYNALGTSEQEAVLTATFTHPITGQSCTKDVTIKIGYQPS